jgi:hypothetical protein
MKWLELSRHGPRIVATAILKVARDLHMGKISTAACSVKIIAMSRSQKPQPIPSLRNLGRNGPPLQFSSRVAGLLSSGRSAR